MTPIRTLFVSTCEMTREAFGVALRGVPALTLVGVVDTVDAVGHVAEKDADVVLIDAEHRHAGALEVTRALTDGASCNVGASSNPVKVIALGLDEDDEIVNFLEAGAAGYVSPQASLADLVSTVVDVYGGLAPCTPRLAALVMRRIRHLARRPEASRAATNVTTDGTGEEKLSIREAEVLSLLADGLRNKEIAQRLGIAVSTAGNHVQKIFTKLGVNGRREAVRQALERGLLNGAPPFAADRFHPVDLSSDLFPTN